MLHWAKIQTAMVPGKRSSKEASHSHFLLKNFLDHHSECLWSLRVKFQYLTQKLQERLFRQSSISLMSQLKKQLLTSINNSPAQTVGHSCFGIITQGPSNLGFLLSWGSVSLWRNLDLHIYYRGVLFNRVATCGYLNLN